MQTFLQEVIAEVRQKYSDLSNIVFILPSKRAGTFLKQCIASSNTTPSLSPEIHSIESFVEKMACLRPASVSQQLFELYNAYLTSDHPKDKEGFYTFSKWSGTLIQDINEMDRYLIDTQKLFSNLADVQKINHWSPSAEKTEMMEEYLQFWDSLEELYTLFNTALLKKGLGHQGLIYRKAHQKLETYLQENSTCPHVFIGFNALNKAESEIIQTILLNLESHIYWDLDSSFLEDPVHDAGHFIREHFKGWPHFRNNPLKGIQENFRSKKEIQIIGVPTNVTQAKYVGTLLKNLNKNTSTSLTNTAVVLSDEGFLNPLLHALPPEIKAINITMGYPLGKTVMASLFLQLFRLHIQKGEQGWYYQEVLDVLAHPYIKILMRHKGQDLARHLSQKIREKNWTYINVHRLIEKTSIAKNYISTLFLDKTPTPKKFVLQCLKIIALLKTKLQDSGDKLSLEYLYRFYTLFNQIQGLLEDYGFINDLKSLQSLYDELLALETLDFTGEPLEGLQIMGMLESRNLDFETVILTSVNEGILPTGKTANSYIPFDLKLHHGLPTYKEKDAIYTYHFYRLLQRAKHIFILYTTQTNGLLGGEKSRLILQLQTDTALNHNITEKTAIPRLRASKKSPNSVVKNKDVLQRIAERAALGFSPTSLTTYIRNPMDFYKRSVMGLDDIQEVEENIAANTFGTVVHDTLEDLYRPFLGKFLTEMELIATKPMIEKCVRHHFGKSYPGSDISSGKNLIAFQVILKYIAHFIDLEIRELKRHRIKIIGLETKLETVLDIPEVGFPVVLKGKLDRIDEKDGLIRIIDYKTGTTTSSQVELWDWQTLITTYDHSKAFQLLCYALLYNSRTPIKNVHAGIIPFKNLSSGLLSFAIKPTRNSRKKERSIDQEVLQNFRVQLKKLILEICSADVPFLEKEI